MELVNQSAETMWRAFRELHPEVPDVYSAWSFGADEKMANELSQLVTQGEKRGTTSLVRCYELDDEEYPTLDDYSVILDGQDKAVCIIKNKQLTFCQFSEVTEQMAMIEGEGDKSLHYWQDAHRDFFSQALKEYHEEFNDEMQVLFEEFQVVYHP